MQTCFIVLALSGFLWIATGYSDWHMENDWYSFDPDLDLLDVNGSLGNVHLYMPGPKLTTHLDREERTLPREHEVKCWTCYTLDTLEVSTNNCNKTLCTGRHLSACYKWHVKYGFKRYRTYRGCMDNYTEIDYENAMCKGTGLPLNETCEWALCKTDFCNSALLHSLPTLPILLLLALPLVFFR
eukprot:sb/3471450/